MQQRYCRCGDIIWVQYLFPNADCRIVFKAEGRGKNHALSQCPGCGRKLDIDDLY